MPINLSKTRYRTQLVKYLPTNLATKLEYVTNTAVILKMHYQ